MKNVIKTLALITGGLVVIKAMNKRATKKHLTTEEMIDVFKSRKGKVDYKIGQSPLDEAVVRALRHNGACYSAVSPK